MSIFIHQDAKIITQGATGRSGRIYTEKCIGYGHGKACFVAGVNPKKAGTVILDMPIYGSMREAKEKTGATVSVIYVPPATAAAAIWEAVEAEIDLVICATEGIPIKDMLAVYSQMEVKVAAGGKRTLLLGPGSPGVLIPEVLKVGMIPDYECRKGVVGVITNSGTITYEIVMQLEDVGLAPSAVIGLGRGSICGLKSRDVLQVLNEDAQTQAVVLVAETGGDDIAEAAWWCKEHMSKPVVVYIAGMALLLGQGTRYWDGVDQARVEKNKAFVRSCGLMVAETLLELGHLLKSRI